MVFIHILKWSLKFVSILFIEKTTKLLYVSIAYAIRGIFNETNINKYLEKAYYLFPTSSPVTGFPSMIVNDPIP